MSPGTEGIRFVGDLSRLDVKPGDRFVLMTDECLTINMHQRLQEVWKGFIDGDENKLLVLERGWRLGVIGANPTNELLDAAKDVMDMLEEHGGSIVPHLLDTDMNAGQRLRDAIAAAEGQP